MSEQLIPTPSTFGENGNLLLERELGSGGMGGVYMGRDKMLDRPVAVKIMLKELGSDAEFVDRFKREAQAAAKLIHPNIAQIYSYGISDGMPYIAMELVPGGSLYSIMQTSGGKTDIQRVLKIGQQVAQALQCATDQGFVHGDVKPENILLDANGNAKLVDFGLAAMQKNTDEIWGTPYYISPEKVKKETVDFRADMYSLGGTLYHALTGVAPFEGEDSIAVVKKRFDGAPKKPSEIRPEITPAIDHFILKMLALNKDERYPSFEALLEAFKEVLTTGLETKTSAAPAAPRPTATRTVAGTRRMTVRGRRTTMMRRPAAKPATESAVSPETAADEDAVADKKDEDEEEEGGGNLGLKVVLSVVGGILAIGAVVGGLIWFKIADAKAREAEHQAQIVANVTKAREAVLDTRKATEKFDGDFADFTQNATKECAKLTGELKRLLPDFANDFQPDPTAELKAAWALTNPPPAVVAAPTNAVPAAASNATAKATAPAATNAAPKQAATPAPAKAEPAAKPAAPPQAVIDVRELWERAYGCQASQIKLHVAAQKILAECDKLNDIKDETEASMKALGELSLTVKDLYDQMVGDKNVENVKKSIGFIKSKGQKVLEQTVKRLRIEKLEADRKAKREAQAAAEKARQEKLAEERKAKVEEETAAVNGVFDALVAQGTIRQLDWKGALRQIQTAKDELTTPEGSLVADLQMRKVNCMKKVQDIFIRKLKGHVFRGKLKGAKVTAVNDHEIELTRPNVKNKQKILWQKFYKDYPGNLNELFNTFIVSARKSGALNLKDWSEAMTGAALTMSLVCAEVNGATEKSEQLVKQTVKEFPEFAETAQQIFPDMKLGEEEEAEEKKEEEKSDEKSEDKKEAKTEEKSE